MQASNPTQFYKTAAELKISQGALDALIWLRSELAAGRLKHGTEIDYSDFYQQGLPAAINMARWNCGTIGCIGGFCETRYSYFKYEMNNHKELYNLCFPLLLEGKGILFDWAKITVPQIIAAIDNYGTTGDSDWRSIIFDKQASAA